MTRAPLLLPLLLALALVAGGCGGGGTSNQPGATPAAAMATAKRQLDRARSVHLSLSTDAQPSGDGILSADGTLTHAPAFKGKVRVSLGGFAATVPVVSVDGTVHAKLPMSSGWAEISPHQYGAPDPAGFADPQHGLSSLLTRLQGLQREGQSRQGRTVLTTYTGTLSGRLVQRVIPSAAAGDRYPCRLGVDDQGRLRTLSVTGPFFSGAGDVSYDVALDDYGKPVTITAP